MFSTWCTDAAFINGIFNQMLQVFFPLAVFDHEHRSMSNQSNSMNYLSSFTDSKCKILFHWKLERLFFLNNTLFVTAWWLGEGGTVSKLCSDLCHSNKMLYGINTAEITPASPFMVESVEREWNVFFLACPQRGTLFCFSSFRTNF